MANGEDEGLYLPQAAPAMIRACWTLSWCAKTIITLIQRYSNLTCFTFALKRFHGPTADIAFVDLRWQLQCLLRPTRPSQLTVSRSLASISNSDTCITWLMNVPVAFPRSKGYMRPTYPSYPSTLLSRSHSAPHQPQVAIARRRKKAWQSEG